RKPVEIEEFAHAARQPPFAVAELGRITTIEGRRLQHLPAFAAQDPAAALQAEPRRQPQAPAGVTQVPLAAGRDLDGTALLVGIVVGGVSPQRAKAAISLVCEIKHERSCFFVVEAGPAPTGEGRLQTGGAAVDVVIADAFEGEVGPGEADLDAAARH